jgi:hypothetical protein
VQNFDPTVMPLGIITLEDVLEHKSPLAPQTCVTKVDTAMQILIDKEIRNML